MAGMVYPNTAQTSSLAGARMNRNPGRPKIMKPCDCGSQYLECNCEWLRLHNPAFLGYVHIPLISAIISVLIVGLYYLFGG
jgi:hypothetical protein